MNAFTILSLFYSLLINIIYYTKKRLITIENKIYELIMLTNFIGVILALSSYYTIINVEKIPLINTLISKGYIIYLLTWITLFSLYIFTISIKENKNKNIELKKISITFAVLYLVFLAMIIFQPLFYYNENGAVYSYGPCANVMYIVSAVYIFVWIIRLFINYKNIKSKKYLPIYAFMLLGLIVMIVQKQHPELLLMTAMETYIVLLMYHTIENPDINVLEEIHKAKEISDNANEEKAMFLYNITNEIRSVTKQIDNLASNILIETDNKKINPESIDNFVREIQNSTARFNTMTNEMLDISQIDSANIRVYNDKYNIKLIIKEFVQIYKKKCIDKNLDFRTSIDSDIPDYLYGDSVGLKNVLTIILDNSIKYTEEGYIEFSINTIMRRDVCRLIISIEDTGSGIKADNLIKIFSKKEEDTEEDRHNLDNNLYNAKRLITLMGGTIIPSSVYDKGTTIKIVLDQKIVNKDNTELSKYEEIYDKKKILLVDDNESSTKIITKLLEDTNIVLDTVTLGSECLDKIRNKEKYDLILLNEEMTPLDGIIIMKKLKSIRTFNTKVILLTRNNDYEYDDDYLKYGFSDHILKPINKNKFLEKIDKCLK